jgi:hypothetical protein
MMSHVAFHAKQPLLRSIRDRVAMAEALLGQKIRAFHQERTAAVELDADEVSSGEARYASVVVAMNLRTKKKTGCNPASASAVLEYELGMVAHAHGPIWVRVERRFKGRSSADIDQSSKRAAPWKLLSECGDLSDWQGDLWTSFWPVLMDDLERIVPDSLTEVFSDQDLYTSVMPGEDFWVSGKCKVSQDTPLSLWAFKKTPAAVPVTPARVHQTFEKAAA